MHRLSAALGGALAIAVDSINVFDTSDPLHPKLTGTTDLVRGLDVYEVDLPGTEPPESPLPLLP